MNKKSLGNFNLFECYVYELLGVKYFRRFILLFERVKHRKDGMKNANYHPEGSSTTSLKSFSGYLLYNTIFHVVSMVLILIYFLIAWAFQLYYFGINLFMYVAIAFNIYCIILQRYNYLKIKSHINKADAKKAQRIKAALNILNPILDAKDDDDFLDEYDIIQKISQSMNTGVDCFLNSDCSETLNRIAVLVEHVEVTNSLKPQSNIEDFSLSHFLSSIPGQTLLVGRVEQRVSKLQNLLKKPSNSNVLFGYSIITEDSRCEEAFCRLFPVRSREKMEYTIAVLLTAYQQKGQVK